MDAASNAGTDQESEIQYPVSDFSLIEWACDPDAPLRPHDPRYFDFTPVRGESIVVAIGALLQQKPAPDKFHQQILAGHKGTGKSTELLQLYQEAGEMGYLCVWMDIFEFFGLVEDLDVSDFYLIVAEHLVRILSTQTVLQPHAEMLDNIAHWFDQVVHEEKRDRKTTGDGAVGLDKIPILRVFAEFKIRREASVDYLTTIRHTVQSRFGELQDRTKALLNMVNSEIRKAGHDRGLLLIFDTMDRFPEQRIEEILMKSDLLRHLACHAIYTMHVSLLAKYRGADFDTYGRPVLMPMLPVRHREMDWADTVEKSPYHEPAVDALVGALGRRLSIDELFEEASDARLLARLSGGCIRDLLHLVTMSRTASVTTLSVVPTRISREGVRKGIARCRQFLTDLLTPADFDRLVQLTKVKSDSEDVDDTVHGYLSQRVALRYCAESVSWTDVHPLVIETEGFRSALKRAAQIQ